MTVHDSLEDIVPEDMPYQREYEIDGVSKIWGFHWNELCRFFTVDLYEVDGTPIYLGEKLVPYQALWRDINVPGLPAKTIMPLDESHQETVLDPGTLGDSFQLCIMDLEGD